MKTRNSTRHIHCLGLPERVTVQYFQYSRYMSQAKTRNGFVGQNFEALVPLASVKTIRATQRHTVLVTGIQNDKDKLNGFMPLF